MVMNPHGSFLAVASGFFTPSEDLLVTRGRSGATSGGCKTGCEVRDKGSTHAELD
jgi:hypothetical protein